MRPRNWTHQTVSISVAICCVLAFAGADRTEVSIGEVINFTAPEGLVFVESLDRRFKVKSVFVVGSEKAARTPKLKLKVTERGETTFEALVKNAKGAGEFDVTFFPKRRDPFVVARIRTVPPAPLGTSSAQVSPKGEVTILGTSFGSKRPKVFIAGRRAKVLEFSDTSITVRTSKKVSLGPADIVVRSRVGESTLAGALEVVDPGSPPPFVSSFAATITGAVNTTFDDPESISGTLFNTSFVVRASQGDETLVVIVTRDLDSLSLPVTINMVPVNSAGDQILFSKGEEPARVVYRFGSEPPPGDATVTVTAWDAQTRVVQGTFQSKFLVDSSGTVTLTGGAFQVQLDDER